MKEFLIYILEQIVTKPEAVEIIEEDDSGLSIFKIKVDPEDMGLVIGKGGKTIKSIRSLIRAKAIKDSVRVRIELLETDDNN